MRRPITIKSLIYIKRSEFNKPSFWRIVSNYVRGIYTRRVYNYKIVAEVDTLRRVATNDIILGKQNTAWVVRGTGHLSLKYGESPFVEITSYRPYSHCDILGNCLVITNAALQ